MPSGSRDYSRPDQTHRTSALENKTIQRIPSEYHIAKNPPRKEQPLAQGSSRGPKPDQNTLQGVNS